MSGSTPTWNQYTQFIIMNMKLWCTLVGFSSRLELQTLAHCNSNVAIMFTGLSCHIH